MPNDRNDGAPSPGTQSKKLTYEPPMILCREPMEAFATVCSPAPPAKENLGSCPLGPIGS